MRRELDPNADASKGGSLPGEAAVGAAHQGVAAILLSVLCFRTTVLLRRRRLAQEHTMALGLILLVLGVGLVLVSLPRKDGSLRPLVRGPFGQALVPTACLALITFGIAAIISNLG